MSAASEDKTIPDTQYAVQLTGPDELRLNTRKPVRPPGPRQILARVEAVGLCFSDLKLLKQFDRHARKGRVLSGLSEEALSEIASYVPGRAPTVPGHEAVCRIVAVGEMVKRHRTGRRVLVQADYRAFRTAGSNAAFGYNFEGALQEYVLMDERIIIDPGTDESLLIAVGEDKSASAVALVEPWACVEESYVSPQRRAPRSGGNMLVVADAGHRVEGLAESLALSGPPAQITAVCADERQRDALRSLGVAVTESRAVADLPDESFDDIIYYGAQARSIEALNDKLAAAGMVNIVTGGARIGRPVSIGVGRIHYSATRWTGINGPSAAESYRHIPATGEIRPADRILIIGAAGPMGQMHVIRCLTCGLPEIEITATDLDDERLEALAAKAQPLARQKAVSLRLVNTKTSPAACAPTYVALMVPAPRLLAEAIKTAAPGCLINIFAGIPASTRQEIDLDACIGKRCWMFGTSGSTTGDMRIVLSKVESGMLDTNASVDAVSGMAGAIDGIRAVENRALAGKIIVYPCLHDLPLVPLGELAARLPEVAAKLEGGAWSKAAEDELLCRA